MDLAPRAPLELVRQYTLRVLELTRSDGENVLILQTSLGTDSRASGMCTRQVPPLQRLTSRAIRSRLFELREAPGQCGWRGLRSLAAPPADAPRRTRAWAAPSHHLSARARDLLTLAAEDDTEEEEPPQVALPFRRVPLSRVHISKPWNEQKQTKRANRKGAPSHPRSLTPSLAKHCALSITH